MSHTLDYYNIAYWYADESHHKCGYCKSERGSISYGMTIPILNVYDYQELIDRGWRRSGKYCYKPVMNKTCCPQYTIRCKALELSLSKSQKKVLKKFNNYLSDGVLQKQEFHQTESGDGVSDVFMREVPSDRLVERDKLTVDHFEVAPKITDQETGDQQLPQTSESLPEQVKTFKKGVGADSTKPPSKKAKLLRLERKKEKLLKRGLTLDGVQPKQQPQKSVEEFINEIPKNAKHKLKLKLIPTSCPGSEWQRTEQIEYELYKKYQIIIHDDPPEKCTLNGFIRFLVSSPLKPCKFPNDADGPGFGSFHQQYWIDDKLIAVGVIDILPKCISSVYFFYDPDYRSLTLGTYGSLRELEFTRSIHSVLPSIEFYYMGYYIHSCPKMRYKGKLSPSYLLCPETYCWFPIEQCIMKLDKAKYNRLNSDSNAVDLLACNMTDIDNINVIIKKQQTKFKYYKRMFNEQELFNTIGSLIGKKILGNFLFQIID